jgi:O-antigen/teichoic acid export membrane protein
MDGTYDDKDQSSAMMLGKRAATVASSVFIGKSINFISLGLAFILIVRLLGPVSYGVYTLAIAVAGIFSLFFDFGVGTALIKFIPQYMDKGDIDKTETLLINGYTIIAIVGVVFTLLAFLLSGFVAQSVLHDIADTTALQAASFTIIASLMWNVSYQVLIALGKSGRIAIAVAIQALVQAIVSLALVLMGFGALGPIIGLVASYATATVFALYVIIKHMGLKLSKLRLDVSKWGELLRFSMPICLSQVSPTLANNLSLAMLGFYSTVVVVGNFGAAYKAMILFDVPLGSIGLALLPLFAVTISNKKITKKLSKYYNYILYYSFLLIAPMVFYIVLLAKPVSYTIFSATYTLTPLYLAIMAVGTFLSVISGTTSSLLIGAGESKRVMKYSIAAAALQVILLPVLLPSFSGAGLAVIMFIIVPIVYCLFYVTRVQKLLKTNVDLLLLAKLLVAAVISALFIIPLLLVMGSSYIPLIIIAAIEQIIVYPAIVSSLGFVSREKLETLDRVANSIPVFGYLIRFLTNYTSLFVRAKQ